MSAVDHWFWWTLTMACVVWYSTITVYVSIRGAADIKSLLRSLSRQSGDTEQPFKDKDHV